MLSEQARAGNLGSGAAGNLGSGAAGNLGSGAAGNLSAAERSVCVSYACHAW